MNEELKVSLEKLELDSGDIVLVRTPVLTGELRRSIVKLLPPDVGAVFLVVPGDSIEKASDEVMLKAGWVRAENACKCGSSVCGKSVAP